MESLGVIAGDSRDELKRGKFFPANVEYQIFPPDDKSDWIYAFDFYGVRGVRLEILVKLQNNKKFWFFQGFDCCSNNAISFHYIQPREMYVYDYLIYYLQPYGHLDIPQNFPAQLTYKDVLLIDSTTSTTAAEVRNDDLLYETKSLVDISVPVVFKDLH
jgi:glycoprotein-N-acetylgalactosamine 3-beta-galactosyltransferase